MDFIDAIQGKKVIIGEAFSSLIFMNFRKLIVDKQFRDDFVEGLKLDFYQVKIISKNYPKYKQILKLIELSNEHRIIKRSIDKSQSV